MSARGDLAPSPEGRLARRLLAQRRERDAMLGDMFGEPAWEILLDLFAAYEERKAVSVSSLCIASTAPPSTALRWISAMEDQGKLIRQHDRNDRRRVNIALTPAMAEQMRRLLKSWIDQDQSARPPGGESRG